MTASEIDAEMAAATMGVSVDNVRKFKFVSDEGYEVRGWISTSSGFTKGSLVITEVVDDGNVYETMQLVQGMPRLKYLHEEYDKIVGRFRKWDVSILEKLDGTNIVFYPLNYETGIVDVVAKTRGLPAIGKNVANGKQFYELLLETGEYEEVKELVVKYPHSCAFELYGYKNKIVIEYDFPIRLTLLAVMDWKWVMPYGRIKDFWHDVIWEAFSIRGNKAVFRYGGDEIEFGDFLELYNGIQDFLDRWNEVNKDMQFEGVVWHINIDEANYMYKNVSRKLRSLYSDLRASDIRRRIREAVRHYGVEERFEDLYEWVYRDVAEDYGKSYADKWAHKIGKVVREYLGKEVAVQISLERILETVLDSLGVNSVSEVDDIGVIMREFARLYPDLRKKYSGRLYNFVRKMISEGGGM